MKNEPDFLAKLSVCLDELRSIVGDRFSDNILIDACINNDFNKDRAYDAVSKTAGTSILIFFTNQ